MDQITQFNEALTKELQESLADQVAENLLENSNCLEALMKLKAFEEVIKKVKAKVDEEARKEADKYGKGVHTLLGVEFQVKNGRATYDYSTDQEYNRLKQELKERETFLKGLKKEMIDPETGEVSTPPSIKFAKESISFTFPKQ